MGLQWITNNGYHNGEGLRCLSLSSLIPNPELGQGSVRTCSWHRIHMPNPYRRTAARGFFGRSRHSPVSMKNKPALAVKRNCLLNTAKSAICKSSDNNSIGNHKNDANSSETIIVVQHSKIPMEQKHNQNKFLDNHRSTKTSGSDWMPNYKVASTIGSSSITLRVSGQPEKQRE